MSNGENGKSGIISVRCPECGRSPGGEFQLLLAPWEEWTCEHCGATFDQPRLQ